MRGKAKFDYFVIQTGGYAQSLTYLNPSLVSPLALAPQLPHSPHPRRFNYRLHPLNRRVQKDPPPRRERKNDHYRRKDVPHPLENLMINPLRMPLTETDIDSVESQSMRQSVMGRRDVKNMSLARFRVCTPLQVKKDLISGEKTDPDT